MPRALVPAPAERAVRHFACLAALLRRDHVPDGARRAPRALEAVEKVLTGTKPNETEAETEADLGNEADHEADHGAPWGNH
jgi:hypothetical protein